MIDVNILREEPDALKANLARRSAEIDVDRLVELDEAVRLVRRNAENARAEQRVLGKQIATASDADRPEIIERAGLLAEEYKRLSAEADALETEFNALWVTVPNLADPSVPTGESDADNVEIKQWGTPRVFDFEVRDHQDIGEALGIIDVAAGAKVSGSRFAYLKGQAVLLELGLVRWAMELLAAEGFTPVIPPVLVREEALYGTGFFPGDQEQVYSVGADDLFLVGTAEVPLAALHADEILTGDLPIRYAGFSTCFRREAGTYGKDTRGIFRVHQFDKVEMFSFCHPDRSWDEHEFLFGMEERIVQALELPYRVVNVAAGDLGSSAAKKYDIEAWIPSQQAFREITSCSNTTDYQARRLKIRMKDDETNRIIHTLNGTAVAVGRTILAIMENHQQADGTVLLPEAIRPYVGFD
ncbi:MAG: serine--tRNA ligase, partial [Acidimicrobiia bacterium]|nr:serine--tRNA ligase [Acidimicrobiia bacterium]